MVKKLVYYPEKCSGCRICMLECVLNHNGAIDYSRSRIRIREDKEKVLQVAEVCVQCEESPCIDACPENALSKDGLGRIVIDKEKCILCGSCANSCPYHGITLDKEGKELLICDLCGGDPACAKWCPTGAMTYQEVTDENLEEVKAQRGKMVEAWKSIYSILK